MKYEELKPLVGLPVVYRFTEKGIEVDKTVTLTGILKSVVSSEYDVCYIKNIGASKDMVALCSKIIKAQ